MNAVAARLSAHVDHGIANTLRLPVKHFILLEDAQSENIHQRISDVPLFEDALTAHCGHDEAVAVMRNAGNHALQNTPVARNVERTKAQGIHHGNGAGSHGEDVAQDAADSGRRALKRLYKTRMVVRFDLER